MSQFFKQDFSTVFLTVRLENLLEEKGNLEKMSEITWQSGF